MSRLFYPRPAGDQFTGTVWDVVYLKNGTQVAPPFLNALGLDAFALGNHEVSGGTCALAHAESNNNTCVLPCI